MLIVKLIYFSAIYIIYISVKMTYKYMNLI